MDSLPSGPSGVSSNDGGFGRRPGRFADERQNFSSGAPVAIDQSRLPTCPPYTAFIGNLSFDVTESDIRTFMQMRNIPASSVLNIKLPRDTVENKSRGFGYVDFSSCEDLTRALLASNQFSIKNRVVRIDLSDSKPQSERELRPAESNKNWRDGFGSSVPQGRSQESREARPVSAAESSRNWRDGANPVERTSVFSSNAEPREFREPREPRESREPREFRDQRESRPPRAAEPVRNWRETAKSVEKTASTVAPIPEEPVKKSAPAPSKVPTGSWRR